MNVPRLGRIDVGINDTRHAADDLAGVVHPPLQAEGWIVRNGRKRSNAVEFAALDEGAKPAVEIVGEGYNISALPHIRDVRAIEPVAGCEIGSLELAVHEARDRRHSMFRENFLQIALILRDGHSTSVVARGLRAMKRPRAVSQL